MIKDNDTFDFSDYRKDHRLYKMNMLGKDEYGKVIIINCKVPGKTKQITSQMYVKNGCM